MRGTGSATGSTAAPNTTSPSSTAATTCRTARRSRAADVGGNPKRPENHSFVGSVVGRPGLRWTGAPPGGHPRVAPGPRDRGLPRPGAHGGRLETLLGRSVVV